MAKGFPAGARAATGDGGPGAGWRGIVAGSGGRFAMREYYPFE
jgi:hypothetical protein